jgi:hypothetical protein
MPESPEKKNRGGPGAAMTALAVILVVLCLILVYFHYWPYPTGDADGLPDWYVPPSGAIETPDWTFDMTQVTAIHAGGIDGTGIIIGIVDTGIDMGHPEFSPGLVVAWKDFINGETDMYDDGGHGTAMASIISATGTLDGVAPGAKLIVAKAIPGEGSGDDVIVGQAIDWCVDPNGDGDLSDGADIISLSLGGGEHPRFGSESGTAARNAIARGVIVVASAGNDGTQDDGDVESPASEELVIAVGAIDSSGTIASFSSVGDNDGRTPQAWDDRMDPNKKPEITAPGVNILAAFPDGLYASVSGTSPAAAFASGAIALALQVNPGYAGSGSSAKVIELKGALMQTAKKLGAQDTPHDDHYGYGLIQAADLSEHL